MVRKHLHASRRQVNILLLLWLLPAAYLCSASQHSDTTVKEPQPTTSRSNQSTDGEENGSQPGSVMGTTSRAIATIILTPFRMMGQAFGGTADSSH
jgi:hypothetical protein